MGGISAKRELRPGKFLVGSGDSKDSVFELDIARVRLHQVCGNFLCFGFDFIERISESAHADRARPRTIGAHAKLHATCVPMDDFNVFKGYANPFADKLCEGCFMALAMAVGAGKDFDLTCGCNLNLSAFPKPYARTKGTDSGGRCEATSFNIGRESDAPFFSAALGLSFAGWEAVIVDECKRFIEGGIVVTDVVVHDDRRLMRERANEILATEFSWIEPQFTRGCFDDPFNQVGCFRASSSSIGVYRCCVGEHSVDLNIDCRQGVLTRQQCAIEISRDGRCESRQVGA